MSMTTREQFETWVMTEICISKSTLEGLRTEDGYRNSMLSGTDYNRMWSCWQAASKASEQQLAAVVAENAGLKSKGREVLNEAYKVYEKLNATINSDSGDFIDGQTLHEFQFLLDVETPATDALLAGIRAQGVDMYADTLDRGADDAERDGFDDGRKFLRAEAEAVRKFAAQLRQGAEHE